MAQNCINGHPIRFELSREGLLVYLANHYTTRGSHLHVLYIITRSFYIYNKNMLVQFLRTSSYFNFYGFHPISSKKKVYIYPPFIALNALKLPSSFLFLSAYSTSSCLPLIVLSHLLALRTCSFQRVNSFPVIEIWRMRIWEYALRLFRFLPFFRSELESYLILSFTSQISLHIFITTLSYIFMILNCIVFFFF